MLLYTQSIVNLGLLLIVERIKNYKQLSLMLLV